jgi:hypothetical protein
MINTYNNRTNNDCWFDFDIPLEKLHNDLLKKRNVTYDLHYFIEHNSWEEMAHCYSMMLASKNCSNTPVDFASQITEEQIAELIEFLLDPQELVVIESMHILRTMGVQLDKQTWIDMYEFSMWHPNAIVCHVCRKIDWKLTRQYFYDTGILECCACNRNRRKPPETGVLDLNFETFDLKKYI